EQPAGVQHERVLGVGQLGRLLDLTGRDEARAAARERVRVEVAGARMVGRGAGPLQSTLAVQARMRQAGQERRELRQLVEDRGRSLVVELPADLDSRAPSHAL